MLDTSPTYLQFLIVPCYYITRFGCLWALLYTFISFLGLTYWLEAQPVLLFFAHLSISKKRNIKRSPNGMKPSGAWFLEQTWSRGLGVQVKKQTRQPRGWSPPYSACPLSRGLLGRPPTYFHRCNLLYPREQQNKPRKPNSTAATFCIRVIPSWSLRQHSARGGIDHGGPLHNIQGLFDELWVVYHRPSSPYLLSLWITIQSSPRSSWRSIRCNYFSGVFSRFDVLWVSDQVYLWIKFGSTLKSFMYDWLSLQVSSNYQFRLAY